MLPSLQVILFPCNVDSLALSLPSGAAQHNCNLPSTWQHFKYVKTACHSPPAPPIPPALSSPGQHTQFRPRLPIPPSFQLPSQLLSYGGISSLSKSPENTLMARILSTPWDVAHLSLSMMGNPMALGSLEQLCQMMEGRLRFLLTGFCPYEATSHSPSLQPKQFPWAELTSFPNIIFKQSQAGDHVWMNFACP